MPTGRLAAAVVAAALATSNVAGAETTFYQGKVVTFISGTAAGGGYDNYARLLVKHFGRHIPGQPSMIVQNMPGAGSMIAANYIANVAARDGSVIALFSGSTLLDSVLGTGSAKFAAHAFTPVGNMNAETDNCVVWSGRGFKSAADVMQREVVTGATGTSSNSYTFPSLMNIVLGTKFKLILGYNGNERVMIMEKGELDAACGLFTSTLFAQFASHLQAEKVIVIMQMGLTRHPRLPDVPSALELARTDEQRQILQLVFSQLDIGRPIFAPPGVPPDRAEALQKAFNAAMGDRELVEDAARGSIEIRWYDAQQLTKTISAMAASPEPARAKVRELLKRP